MFNQIKDFFRPALLGTETCVSRWELVEKSIPVLMGIFVFFNPFPHTTSIKEVSFYLSFAIVVLLIVFKKTKFTLKMPLSLPLVLFAVWAFVGLFFALDKENSVHDFRSHLLRYMVLYFLLVNYFGSKKRLLAFSWVIMVSVSVASVAGLYWYYFVEGNAFSKRFGLFFTEVPCNQIGLITVFATILCVHHLRTVKAFSQKIGVLLLSVPMVLATIMTQARSAVLAMCLSIAMLLFPNKKALLGVIIVLPIVVTLTPVGDRFLSDITNNIRIRQHLLTWEVIKDYPVTGIGFGLKQYASIVDLENYALKLPAAYRDEWYNMGVPHAMFMHIAVTVGIIGFVLFLWILIVVFKMCWQCIQNGKEIFQRDWGYCIVSSLAGFLFIGLFEPVSFHAGEVVLFSIFAMATIVWRINKDCVLEKI